MSGRGTSEAIVWNHPDQHSAAFSPATTGGDIAARRSARCLAVRSALSLWKGTLRDSHSFFVVVVVLKFRRGTEEQEEQKVSCCSAVAADAWCTLWCVHGVGGRCCVDCCAGCLQDADQRRAYS